MATMMAENGARAATAEAALANAVRDGRGSLSSAAKRTLNVFGVEVAILVTGDDTDGAYVLCRVGAEPGMGAPPHRHTADDEAFHVLEGTFEFLRGGEVLRLGPGERVFLPRGVPHAFRNVGDSRGWVLELATPSAHERFFEDADRLSFPPDPEEAAAVCRRHGIELLMPG